MNKLLLAICFLISTSTYAEESATVGNLTIKMFDKRDNWLKIYKDDKIIFDKTCQEAWGACRIYPVKSESFDFVTHDGVAIVDNKVAFHLEPKNITIFSTGWFNQNKVIGFVVSIAGGSGRSGDLSLYTINIDSGDISEEHESFDNGSGI